MRAETRRAPERPFAARDVALLVLLVVAYVVTGRLGLTLAYYSKVATLVWAPSGIAVASMWLAGPRRFWPTAFAVALAATITNMSIGGAPTLAMGFAIGNTLEAIVASALLRRAGLRDGLHTVRQVVLFVGFAVAGATVIAAANGVLWLSLLASLPASRALPTALIWWLGDAGGVLVVTPLVLAFAKRSTARRTHSATEGALIAVLAPALASVSFGTVVPGAWSGVSLALLPFPVLVWAAVRFGMRGASAATTLVTVAAVAGTALGRGPFHSGNVHVDVASLWILLATLSVSAMLLAASLEEHAAEASARREGERLLSLSLEASDAVAFEHDFLLRRVRTHHSTTDEWIDRDAWALGVVDEDRAAVLAAIEACARGERDGWECDYRLAGEEQRWIQERGRVEARDGIGRPTLAAGLRRDVSQRHREELQRRALERELEDNKRLTELGLLAGGIAHDFNNLLMIVRSNVELARIASPHVPEALAAIDEAAARAAELTDQLLAYAGRRPMQRRDVDLFALANETVRMLAATVPDHVVLRLASDEQVPLVRADPAQLRQVLMNLLLNAVQAIEPKEQSSVTVTVTRVGPDVCVSVHDDGRGMDAETAARIFQPFFTTKAHGRGLGMAAVLGIVRTHGGRIDVESRPGEGTTVRVQLPATDRLPRASASVRVGTPVSSPRLILGRRVLVADDEPGIRLVTEALLSEAGFAVTLAASGREAKERVANDGPFDVALLDVTMPDVHGLSLLRELRDTRPSLPIVLMSGYSEHLLDGSGLEEVPFLHKPFREAELIARLDEAMRGRATSLAGE